MGDTKTYKVTDTSGEDRFTMDMSEEAYEAVVRFRDGLGSLVEDILIEEDSEVDKVEIMEKD